MATDNTKPRTTLERLTISSKSTDPRTVEISPIQTMQGLMTLGQLFFSPSSLQIEAEKTATSALLASYQRDVEELRAENDTLKAQIQKGRDRFHHQEVSARLAAQGLWAEEP